MLKIIIDDQITNAFIKFSWTLQTFITSPILSYQLSASDSPNTQPFPTQMSKLQ